MISDEIISVIKAGASLTWRQIFNNFKEGLSDEEIDYLLWNETCYPFDNEWTIKQIERYFENESHQRNIKD